MNDKIESSFNKLATYCEMENFKGYDPYDSLNSKFFRSIPIASKVPLIRLAWTQFFKRSPVNLRSMVGVEKEYNPKALGLFLSAHCLLYKKQPREEYLERINSFSSQLLAIQNRNWSGSCWGYNFDWQARAFFQPKNTPTVVASTFIGCALLDAYEITGRQELLDTARSTCDFILNDLNRTYDEKENFSFSYSPLDKSVVFNASLLGSRTLARVYSFTKEKALKEAARKSVSFCCDHQRKDGSWSYGTYEFHKWIDNFHTGYNLECLTDYMSFTGDQSFANNLAMGYDYYISTFFTEEGISKYYNNSIYPIDIHAPTQLVITLSKLGKFHDEKELVDKVMNWTIDNMQSDQGYFYYQINKYFTSKIPYMRWAQAWMFYALCTYLISNDPDEKN